MAAGVWRASLLNGTAHVADDTQSVASSHALVRALSKAAHADASLGPEEFPQLVALTSEGVLNASHANNSHHEGQNLSALTSGNRVLVIDTSKARGHRRPLSVGQSCRFASHGAEVRSVSFSPDARLLATASDDKSIMLWRTATGELLRTLDGHEGWVLCVEWSPDGTSLTSGSRDAKIRIWDSTTGDCTNVLSGHQSRVFSVAFSPDGKRLASGSNDASVKASALLALRPLALRPIALQPIALQPIAYGR